MSLLRWKVVGKKEISMPVPTRQDKPAIPDARLILICEREGVRREAVVSHEMWNGAKMGDEVALREDLTLPRCMT